MKKNIAIADSQFLILEAFKCMFRNCEKFELTYIAADIKELEELLEKIPCHLLITDPHLFNDSRFDYLQNIKKKYPQIALLVCVNQINKSDIGELTKIGIKNIVLKTAEKDEIFNALDASLKGKKYYCSEILDILLEVQEKRSSTGLQQLSTSELEIVKQIAAGLTTKEIAEKRNLSFHTIMTHRKNIFRKTGVNNTSELLMYAMRNGFFDLEYYI